MAGRLPLARADAEHFVENRTVTFDNSLYQNENRLMPDCAEAASPAAPQKSSANARAARLAKFEREQVIVDYLNRGVSVAEIAARIDVSEKRMRAIIREILARRMPAPPEEFVAIQVSRLNEALLVAYSAMGEMNLKAVDRVVRIVRELDRYHGFSAARRLPEPSRIEAPVEGAMTFGAALVCRPDFAPQGAENMESAPALRDLVPSLSKNAPDPTNLGRLSMLRDATLCVAPRQAAQGVPSGASARDDRRELPSQDIETFGSAPRNATVAEAASAVKKPSEQNVSADLVQSWGWDDRPAVSAAGSGLAVRPENPAQQSENMESAPGFAIVSEVARTSRRAVGRPGPGQDVPAPDAPPDDRPANPSHAVANVESAPGNGRPAEASSSGGAADVGPTFPNPIGFRPLKVRMTLNGVMAC
jgi:transposase-like protein